MTAGVAKDYTNDHRAAYFHVFNQAREWRAKPLVLHGDDEIDAHRIQNRKDYLRSSVGAANWLRTAKPSMWTNLP